MPNSDILTEADIKILVDKFYDSVLSNPAIGFIFTDVANLSLALHMPIMYSFWSSVLLGSNGYSGNPMIKHMELDKLVRLEKQHFETWLGLWEQTVNQNFSGPVAADAIFRAKNIASLMLHKIENNRTY